jgi:hypothetical protein
MDAGNLDRRGEPEVHHDRDDDGRGERDNRASPREHDPHERRW